MPILFAVIARGSTVLAEHAECAGNFIEVTEQVLAKMEHTDCKITYQHGSYLFHAVCEGRINFLCITDDDFERSRAFRFLGETKRKFQLRYGDRVYTALPYAMNGEFSGVLATQMKHASSPQHSAGKAEQVQAEVNELKGIMVQNIEALASRGERLELLVNKTEELSASSVGFRNNSTRLRRSMWWKNAKMMFILAVVVVVLLLIVLFSVCGFDFKKCSSSSK